MAEPFETLREVGVAIDGFRRDVSGQFTTLKWIIGGITTVGLGAGALMFNKIDRLEEIAARNTAILERIEAQVNKVASDTGSIGQNIQSVSVEPKSNSFEGYIGVRTEELEGSEAYRTLKHSNSPRDGWIFLPTD